VPDRLDVRFPAGEQQCAAWLYLPERSSPPPVVILGHGLGAVRQMRLDAYAERFLAAGYACLVFDYRHLGDSDGEPRQLVDINEQLADWASAIAYARSRPELDPNRVVLWGSSFGGGHVLVAAARDQGVAAVVSQCLFTDGPASALAMSPAALVKVAVRTVRDLIGSLLRRPPVMVAVAGRPGSTALLTAPDALPGYLGLVPDGVQFRNEVAARLALHSLRYRPGRSVSRIACPVLFCVCEHDSVAPSKATLRHARRSPRVEVRLYPLGHFDIYSGDGFERAVADQIAFLARHVPA